MTENKEFVSGEEEPRCSLCGATSIFANEYGYVQCRVCGRITVPNCGGGVREGYHRTSKKPWAVSETLEEFAGVYGYSTRRFYDQVRSGRVLGMGYQNGQLAIRSAPDEVVGPVADKSQEVMLPVGTRGISVDVCSGSAISGRPYVERIDLARKHPSATLRCPPGCSGTYVRIFCDGLD